MSPRYRIYSGDQSVTNLMNRSVADEEEARELAREVSESQPGVIVSVVSVVEQPGVGDWTRTAATFQDGKPHPWVWEVQFSGSLFDVDHLRLNEQGITYMGGGSEIRGDVLRAGVSRHRLAVEALDAEAAAGKVRAALGAIAAQMSDWTSEPGDDQTVSLRLDSSPPPP